MSSMTSKEASSAGVERNRSDEEIDNHPPPPYQEASLSARSRIRTLRVQYDEGRSPKRLSVFEANNLGEGQQPLYWAKLHTTKLISGGAHMEFKSAHHNEDIGSAKFHKTGSARIDLNFRDGRSTTMTGYAGTTYSMMNFMCPSAGTGGQKLQWKQPGQGLYLICVDPDDNNKKQLASIQFGSLSKPVGEFAIENVEQDQHGHWVEEIMISGLAYVHLSKYMPNYAGGRGSIGVGAC